MTELTIRLLLRSKYHYGWSNQHYSFEQGELLAIAVVPKGTPLYTHNDYTPTQYLQEILDDPREGLRILWLCEELTDGETSVTTNNAGNSVGYQCPHCSMYYTEEKWLRSHINDKHPKEEASK